MKKYIFCACVSLGSLILGKSSAIFPDFMGAMAFQKKDSIKNPEERNFKDIVSTVESLIISIESNVFIMEIFWRSHVFKNFTLQLLKQLKFKDIQPVDLNFIAYLCFPYPWNNLSLEIPKETQEVFNNLLNSFFCDAMIVSLMKEDKIFPNLSQEDRENIIKHKDGPLRGFFAHPLIQQYGQLLMRDLSLLLSYDPEDFLNHWEGFEEFVRDNILVAARGMENILQKNLPKKKYFKQKIL